MSASPKDPFEAIVASEKMASMGEIKRMEGLALDLLWPVEAELHRSYGLQGPLGELTLATLTPADTPHQTETVATVKNLQDDLVLMVGYGSDTMPQSLFYSNEMVLDEASKILHDLIEKEEGYDGREIAIIRALQSLTLSISCDIRHLADASPPSLLDGTTRPVAEVIKELVDYRTDVTLVSKEWGIAFDEDHVLTIIQHTVESDEGEYVDLDSVEAPALCLEYEDREKLFNYCYVRNFNGEITLAIYKPEELIEFIASDKAEQEQQEEMYEQMEAEGAYIPTKSGIELLRGVLIDATVMDSGITEGL